MKTLTCTLLLLVGLFLVAVAPVRAQGQDTDVLRNKIELLENTDVKSKSATVQKIYRDALLDAYKNYLSALKQDIADLKSIQSAASGTGSETQNEAAQQIKRLTDEQTITTAKLHAMTGDAPEAAPADAATTQAPATQSNPRMMNTTFQTGGRARKTADPENKVSVASIPAVDSMTGQGDIIPCSKEKHIDAPTLDSPVSIESKKITGTASNAGAEIQLFKDSPDGSGHPLQTTTVTPQKTFVFKVPPVTLAKGDILYVRQKLDATCSDFSAGVEVMDKEKAETAKATAEATEADIIAHGPVGLIYGGSVISNQAQSFTQADPFFGFAAGYTSQDSISTAQEKDVKGRLIFADDEGTRVYIDSSGNYRSAEDHKPYTPKGKPERVMKARSGMNKGNINLRFDGLFNSAPRTAAAPAAKTTTATAAAAGVKAAAAADDGLNQDIPFLSSRKTFETDMKLWWSRPFLDSQFLRIGLFAEIGATSVMDKNELKDEDVSVPTKNAGTAATTTDGMVKLDTSKVKSDNDLKKFFEFGPMVEVYTGKKALFLQAFLGFGKFEALKGLYKNKDGIDNYDTSRRFHGQLRIFPASLARGFGKTKITPMFGVDINASRGPDSLRFFSGFIMSIPEKGIPTGAATTAAADKDAGSQATPKK